MSPKDFLRKNIFQYFETNFHIFTFSHFLQEIEQKLTNIGDFHVCKGFFRKNIFSIFLNKFSYFHILMQEIGQKLTNIGDFHVCKGFS